MGIRSSDVVLNSQARPGARRCGAEAWMTEGKGRGSIESGHEGLDPRPVLLLDVVNVSTVDRFDGNTRSKLVEGLMGVHDEEVYAIRAATTGGSHSFDVPHRQFVVLGRWNRTSDCGEPPGQRLCCFLVGDLKRSEHGGKIVGDASDQHLRTARRSLANDRGFCSGCRAWLTASCSIVSRNLRRSLAVTASASSKGRRTAFSPSS